MISMTKTIFFKHFSPHRYFYGILQCKQPPPRFSETSLCTVAFFSGNYLRGWNGNSSCFKKKVFKKAEGFFMYLPSQTFFSWTFWVRGMQVIDFTLLQEFDSSSHNHPTVQMTHTKGTNYFVCQRQSLFADQSPFMVLAFEIWVCAIYSVCSHIWLCTKKPHQSYNCNRPNEKNSGSSFKRVIF